MQAELARHHHHHNQNQQRSNINPSQYMNVSIPYAVPPSTNSNYHLLSDPNVTSNNNGNNTLGAEPTSDMIDIHNSDSASHSSCSVASSAASSFVHLPLAGVDGISTRRESLLGYDNVRCFF